MHFSKRPTARVVPGIAVSLALALFGCSESSPDERTESGPLNAAGSPENSEQGGAGPVAAGSPGGASSAVGTPSTEGAPAATPLDMGAGGRGNTTPAAASDAGAVGPATDAGSQLGEPNSPAFSPCPVDGSACEIMPLGDSITDGLVGNAPGNTGQSVGGYRVELFRRSLVDGHELTFVGRNQNGPGNVDGQPFPMNHEGYSGATISTGMNQLANRIDAALAANPPDIILLHIGTNNLYQGMPPDLPDQLANLLDQITDAAPDALVVVAQITPLAESAFPNNGVDQYNAVIPGLVQERVDAGKHLLVVDMNAAFRAASADIAALVGDNIHPNATGYGLLADAWYATIESFLP